MADDEELDRQSLVAPAAIRVCQNIEILLFRNAADIEQANLAISGHSILLPERGIALLGIEELMIEPARKNFQFRLIEAALNPALTIFFRIYEDNVELAVKPM